MKLDISTVIILFVISLFCGVIIVAIGLGAAFPVINRVATPLACNGQLQLSTDTYSYQPGEQTTTITWFCVDEKTGAKKDVSWKIILTAGLVYSLLIFAAFTVRWLVVNRPGQSSAGSMSVSAPPAFPRSANIPDGALKRLTELKQMHDSNLITDQEYENKKAEILKEL